ncbi:hypothetical protein GQ457_13G025550 [Hibiscus cannabinus]
MMDTPEKIGTSSSLSKFEDSPVFNYINSLSPIKPVKSVHVSQTFNPLSFASLPSIFTSPHVSSHKESRFLKRSTDPSKPELSSADGTKVSTNEEAGVDVQENFDPGVSLGEVSFELHNEPSRTAIELPQTLQYVCGSPKCDPTPCVIEMNCVSEPTCTSLAIVPFVHEASQKGLSDGVEVAATFQIEQKRETIGCEWEGLISDTSDLLIFNSPNDSEAFTGVIQKSLEAGTIELNEINHMNESFEDNNVTNFVPAGLTDYMEAHMSAPYSMKPGSNLHRGFRRRCLDFEVLAARRKSLDGGSNTNSSVDSKMEPGNPGGDSSRCIVPGIGLHLNALAIASRDNKSAKVDTLLSGTEKLILPCSTTSNSPTAGQETAHESFLASASTERETNDVENRVKLADDASQASAYVVNEELNQNSPKKKIRRLEQAGESEACKRCNCKKSKCLKLYCECFAAGVYCIEPCSCQDCFNKPIHEDTVLATRKQIESRNPLAFAPKVIRTSDPIPEVGEDSITTPASARHKRGCNCKKSNCLKKYCECFQGGVGCSINCRCEGCKNAFGVKDGSAIVEAEGEPEDEETDPSDKNAMNKNSEDTDILNTEEQNPAALPTTPLQLHRPLVQLPFSSKSKPPRSFITIGSSSVLYTGNRYGKPNIIRPQSIIGKRFQSVGEDETPEILRGNSSPGTGIKTLSPNSKRISPPQCELGSTPGGARSGRKLILQSIPSFPSLTPKH